MILGGKKLNIIVGKWEMHLNTCAQNFILNNVLLAIKFYNKEN